MHVIMVNSLVVVEIKYIFLQMEVVLPLFGPEATWIFIKFSPIISFASFMISSLIIFFIFILQLLV